MRAHAFGLAALLLAPVAAALDPLHPFEGPIDWTWAVVGTCAVDAGPGVFCGAHWYNGFSQDCSPGRTEWSCTLWIHTPMVIVTRWIGEADGVLDVRGACEASLAFHVQDAEIRRVYRAECPPFTYTVPNDLCDHSQGYSVPFERTFRIHGILGVEEREYRDLELWECA